MNNDKDDSNQEHTQILTLKKLLSNKITQSIEIRAKALQLLQIEISKAPDSWEISQLDPYTRSTLNYYLANLCYPLSLEQCWNEVFPWFEYLTLAIFSGEAKRGSFFISRYQSPNTLPLMLPTQRMSLIDLMINKLSHSPETFSQIQNKSLSAKNSPTRRHKAFSRSKSNLSSPNSKQTIERTSSIVPFSQRTDKNETKTGISKSLSLDNKYDLFDFNPTYSHMVAIISSLSNYIDHNPIPLPLDNIDSNSKYNVNAKYYPNFLRLCSFSLISYYFPEMETEELHLLTFQFAHLQLLCQLIMGTISLITVETIKKLKPKPKLRDINRIYLGLKLSGLVYEQQNYDIQLGTQNRTHINDLTGLYLTTNTLVKVQNILRDRNLPEEFEPPFLADISILTTYLLITDNREISQIDLPAIFNEHDQILYLKYSFWLEILEIAKVLQLQKSKKGIDAFPRKYRITSVNIHQQSPTAKKAFEAFYSEILAVFEEYYRIPLEKASPSYLNNKIPQIHLCSNCQSVRATALNQCLFCDTNNMIKSYSSTPTTQIGSTSTPVSADQRKNIAVLKKARKEHLQQLRESQ